MTNQGKTRWIIIDKAFNEDKLIEYRQALITDADRKVFLILDNLRVHYSTVVKIWGAERNDLIEFYLPNYSPQLSAELKQEIGKRVPVRTKIKQREATSEYMVMLKCNPERVISYFQDRRVKYAV